MKKRIASAVLCFVLTALLCSCTRTYAPVTVNSEKIGYGVYAYFVNRAQAENPEADEAQRNQAAMDKLRRYVAVNSEFAARGLTLDASDKSSVANSVNNYWHTFCEYYEKIGVTRQDIYRIELNKAYEQSLMLNYYSSDSPVSDEQLKQYFSDNFIAFRAVTGFLTTVDENSNAVKMTEEQKQPIISAFNAVAADVNDSGLSLLGASGNLQNVTVTEDIIVVSSDNSYPDGFYEKIRELENGKAASFVIGDYIFCVQRYEILSDEYSLFSKYRTDCLAALKGEEFGKVVDSWAQAYSASSK